MSYISLSLSHSLYNFFGVYHTLFTTVFLFIFTFGSPTPREANCGWC